MRGAKDENHRVFSQDDVTMRIVPAVTMCGTGPETRHRELCTCSRDRILFFSQLNEVNGAQQSRLHSKNGVEWESFPPLPPSSRPAPIEKTPENVLKFDIFHRSPLGHASF